jgi:hypothetical protein
MVNKLVYSYELYDANLLFSKHDLVTYFFLASQLTLGFYN